MSANEISDTTWIYLIEDLLVHRDAMTGHSHLTPFVEDFEVALGDLKGSVGESGDDPELERLKQTARDADDGHDDAHRALYRLLEAFTFHGSPSDRDAVAKGLEALYPDKLAIISASFNEEVGATEAFARRLGDAAVVDALTVLTRAVPGVATWTERCLSSGRVLGDAIKAIQAYESGAPAVQEGKAVDLITTRGQVRRLWRLFMQTMDFAYPAGATDHDALREQLLGRYFREVTG